MNHVAPPGGPEDEPPFRTLTAEEAQRLREQQPQLPLWKVLAGQLGMGVLVAVAAWAVTGKPEAGWSAAYGALAVVVPAAIFARGLTGRFASRSAGRATAAFMAWEMVKIALTIAMLAVAPKVVAELNWLALLAGLVVTLKVYWMALAFSTRKPAAK
ncbi:MAG TPA: ATP synthase subunit I [Ramlibacter sp.]|nr:ATP synthase subunit I [Ramlibacter sp.]